MASKDRPPKDRAQQVLDTLGDDTSYGDIVRALAFDRLIERGLRDADAGHLLDQATLRERVRAWWS